MLIHHRRVHGQYSFIQRVAHVMKWFLQVLPVFLTLLDFLGRGYSCPTFSDVSLKRVVSKQGFHRELKTSLHGNFSGLDSTKVRFLLMETFPAGFYIDQYELANLRNFGGPEVLISEDVDVEKPAHLSHQFSFFVFAEVIEPKDGQFNVLVTLPIHLRYQQPQMNGDRHMSVLPIPTVGVTCGDQFQTANSNEAIKAPCNSSGPALCHWKKMEVLYLSEPLKVSVPIGQKNHVGFVICGTLVAISTLTLLLLRTMYYVNNFVEKDK